MLGAICGDIIGSVFEHKNYKAKDFELFDMESRFTDDTVLTTAIADSILQGESYMSSVRKYYHLYPYAGYGQSFQLWARSDERQGYNSFGNGSAMRVSPVGWAYGSLEEVLFQAEASAVITHSHPEGIKGAKAVAGAIFIARNGGRKTEIKQFAETLGYDLNFHLDDIRDAYQFDVSCQGSVPQAITAFIESNDFEDAIRNAVSIGGDSDTIACIAGSIAEAYYNGVPRHIEDACLDRLDARLLRVYDTFDAKFVNV